MAQSIISDNGISSPEGTFTNVSAENLNVTGTVTSANINSEGNISVEQDNKICFDGTICNVYQYYNGSALITKVN